MAISFSLITCLYVSLHFHHSYSSSPFPAIGVHPLDVKYYEAEVIECKDGSKSFTRDRLNDDFCDCVDGTDEPDCCDGSDEYDGTVICPNTCIMGGNIVHQKIKYDSPSNLYTVHSRKSKPGTKLDDSARKLIGLKTLIFLQVGLLIFIMVYCLFRKRKSRRRNFR